MTSVFTEIFQATCEQYKAANWQFTQTEKIHSETLHIPRIQASYCSQGQVNVLQARLSFGLILIISELDMVLSLLCTCTVLLSLPKIMSYSLQLVISVLFNNSNTIKMNMGGVILKWQIIIAF